MSGFISLRLKAHNCGNSGLGRATPSTHLLPCGRWTPALCVTPPWQWPQEAPEGGAARLWYACKYRELQFSRRGTERPELSQVVWFLERLPAHTVEGNQPGKVWEADGRHLQAESCEEGIFQHFNHGGVTWTKGRRSSCCALLDVHESKGWWSMKTCW